MHKLNKEELIDINGGALLYAEKETQITSNFETLSLPDRPSCMLGGPCPLAQDSVLTVNFVNSDIDGDGTMGNAQLAEA
ncbi:MAG: hypothetical protein K940chlam7_00622 [Chlamydiae bacterium]|nr:hypothetical protein [Chlamydiota bacterium]